MTKPRPAPARHRWLDEWQGASGPPLVRLVEETAALLAQHEAETGVRQRKRREADERRHRTAVEAVVANLAYAVLMPPETGRLAVLTGHAEKGFTRYDNPAFGKPFAGLLNALVDIGLVTLHAPALRRGEAWSIAPTSTFAAQVSIRGIGLSGFRRLPLEESIILKRKTRKGSLIADASPRLVDYPDTGATVAMRDTVQDLNAFLDGAAVSFVDDGGTPVDHRQRRMLRHFVLMPQDEAPRFDRAGRLFGGFWQNLKRTRRAGIRIEGEPVVDLDFASMFPRLAYASTGTAAPDGDLYAIEGLGPEHRPALKLAVNTLLFDDFRRTSWPVPENDETPKLPPDWTVARTKAAILKLHPPLRDCFGVGLGFSLMHTESVILIHALEEMRARGIVGLGLHDGLLLPRSRAHEGRVVMEDVARVITSQRLSVVLKGTPQATR